MEDDKSLKPAKAEKKQETKIDKRKSLPQLFKPGQSGNPADKKPGTKHFSTIFMDILKEEIDHDGKKVAVDKIMSMAMTKKAMKGDVQAFNAVADRVDGKPQQKTEMDVELTLNEGLTKEEKEALLKLIE